VPTFKKSGLYGEIFLKICSFCSKNAEFRSKKAILGGGKCRKFGNSVAFCDVQGAVFHRETLGVSCMKHLVDQIEMEIICKYFFKFIRFYLCTTLKNCTLVKSI